MKLADETYGQAWQMTIAEGPDVNAEECGHWYSPTAVARMIEEEREACAKTCEDFDFNKREEIEPPRTLPRYLARAIRMRSNA